MAIKAHVRLSKLGLAAKIRFPESFSWDLGGTLMGLGVSENICDSLTLPISIPGPELCLRFQYNSHGLGKFKLCGEPTAEVIILMQLSKQLFRGLWNQLHFMVALDGTMMGWLNGGLIYAASFQKQLANVVVVRLSCFQNVSECDIAEQIELDDIVIKANNV